MSFVASGLYNPFTMREMQGRDLNDFRAFGREQLVRYVLAALICGIAAGFLAPFDSNQTMYTGPRYIYWISMVCLGWAQMLFISYGMRTILSSLRWPGWAIMAVIAAVGSVPIMFETWWMSTALMNEPPAEPIPLWSAYIRVYAITIAFSLVQWTVIENWSLDIVRKQGETTADAPGPMKTIRLDRMPEGLNGEILCLQTDDHYLRVHTSEGSDLILHRLSDAVRELDGCDGMQVHRSWWVAKEAIEAARIENNRHILALKNGILVPVSRKYLPDIRKAGWID